MADSRASVVPRPFLVGVGRLACQKEGAGVLADPLGDHALGGKATPPNQTARGRLLRAAFGAKAELSHPSASSLLLLQKRNSCLCYLLGTAVYRRGMVTGCPRLWSGPDKLTPGALRPAQFPSHTTVASVGHALSRGFRRHRAPPSLHLLTFPRLAQGDGQTPPQAWPRPSGEGSEGRRLGDPRRPTALGPCLTPTLPLAAL